MLVSERSVQALTKSKPRSLSRSDVKTDLAAVKKTSDDAAGVLIASDILDGSAPSRIRADARAHMAMIEEKKPVMEKLMVRTRGAEMPHIATNLCQSSVADS